MALPPQGLFSFPGIIAPVSGKYLCSHGIEPGRIIIRAAYQDAPFLNVADMTISYGNQFFFVRDCKVVEQVNYYDTNDGWISEYTLLDRRWRWRFGEIEGNYNRKIRAGNIDSKCERTPQQLAKLLFEAMKEQLYDFSELPNGTRPEVLWVGANPAQELQSIVSALGCRIVYDPLSNTVKIRRGGEGASLPFLNSVDQVGSNLTKPAIPSGIRVVGGVTRVQMPLELAALAGDLDGSLKLVRPGSPDPLSYDADLVNDTGFALWWEREPVAGPRDTWFPNVSDEEQRKLLQKTMWQYYRPYLPGYLRLGSSRDFKLDDYLAGISGGGPQYLEIENLSLELNEEYYDDETNELTKQGYAAGIFNLNSGGGIFLVNVGATENTSVARGDTIYPGSIQVINDHDFPYIIFDRPVWQWDGKKKTLPSDRVPEDERLYLVCTFDVRNRSLGQTCSLHHYSRFYQLVNDPTVGPEVFSDNSLTLRPVEGFSPDILSFGPTIEDNQIDDDLILRTQEIMANRARRYESTEAGNAAYQEFILINLDGAIQSVVWSFGKNGATTEVYRNSEPDYVETRYDRRLTFDEIRRKAGVT